LENKNAPMKGILLPAIFLLSAATAIAQPGTLDLDFNAQDVGFGFGDGPNNPVWDAALQTDGKVLIGGDFTRISNVDLQFLARLNADGSIDSGFDMGTGPNGVVRSIAVQPDGRILIAGGFSEYNGIPRNTVARVNSDGSLDETFDPGAGANVAILKLILLPDGRMLIQGNFTEFDGTARMNIARLNADGSHDLTFNIGTGPGGVASPYVSSIAVQGDGRIVAVGAFQNFNGVTANKVVRLLASGTVDNTFNAGSGPNLNVVCVAIQPDGRILVGGSFTQFNGSNRRRIARLLATGTVDATFQVGQGGDNTVVDIALQSDGRILVAGSFTTFNLLPWQRFVRLNDNGGIDNTFAAVDGANSTPNILEVAPDDAFYLGADVYYFSGHHQPRLMRVQSDGQADPAFVPNTGVTSVATSLAVQPDGRILLGGRFAKYNGTLRRSLCRVLEDGTLDTSFDTGEGFNKEVNAVLVQPDGKVLVTGDFTRVNGLTRNRIARLEADGSVDTTFDPGAGLDSWGHCLALQPDGKIIVGGIFANVGGVAKRGIARLNTDGTLDLTFAGSGVNDVVYSVAVDAEGRVLVGGYFSVIHSTSRNNLARLLPTGFIDQSFSAIGPNGSVESIVHQPDSLILIGGGFSQIGAQTRRCLARLFPNGTLDLSLNIANPNQGVINSLALTPEGKILAGGTFNSVGGTEQQNFAQFLPNGNVDPDYMIGTAANNVVLAVARNNEGAVYIAGTFTAYDGIGRNRFARINGDISTSMEGVPQPVAPRLAAWPNPARDVLHLDAPISGTLHDASGRVVRSILRTSRIDLNGLPSGVYSLRGDQGAALRVVVE